MNASNAHQAATAEESTVVAQEKSTQKQEFRLGGPPLRLLFVCTDNSARSQLAEALTRHLSQGQVQVFSAGSHPASQLHPEVTRAVVRMGADVRQHVPKPLERFHGQVFDRVVVLYDRASEGAPSFAGTSKVISWDFPDPARVEGTEKDHARAFHQLNTELTMRIRLLLSLFERKKREQE